jgi:hypothetical protein
MSSPLRDSESLCAFVGSEREFIGCRPRENCDDDKDLRDARMKIAQHRTRRLAKIKQMTVTWRSSSRPRIILRVGCINLVMQQQPRSNHLRFRSSASNVKA